MRVISLLPRIQLIIITIGVAGISNVIYYRVWFTYVYALLLDMCAITFMICVSAYAFIYMYIYNIYMYICIYVYIDIYIYIYMHIYIYRERETHNTQQGDRRNTCDMQQRRSNML